MRLLAQLIWTASCMGTVHLGVGALSLCQQDLLSSQGHYSLTQSPPLSWLLSVAPGPMGLLPSPPAGAATGWPVFQIVSPCCLSKACTHGTWCGCNFDFVQKSRWSHICQTIQRKWETHGDRATCVLYPSQARVSQPT